MAIRINDKWGTVINSPPVYYIATDTSALAVSRTKQAMDLAIGAWGNYGPVEVNIIGGSVNAALQLEAEYSARHEASDPKWKSEWDSPSTDPSSGFHIYTPYATSGNASVSPFRREYLSEDFFMLNMGTKPYSDRGHSAVSQEGYQRVVLHEYWHVYQHSHVRDFNTGNLNDVNPRDEKLHPYMTEGGANYMALKLYNSTHDMRGDYVLTEMKKFLTEGNALVRYKTNDVLLQNITKASEDKDLYYSIGAWFIAYLESKHTAEHYSVTYYNDLDSLGHEAAFAKTYGKSSTDYLAEFEIFINQPLDDILEIIPSTASNSVVSEDVNVVVTTLGDLGADIVYGTNSSDRIESESGNDQLYGRQGNDTLLGGDGFDHAYFTGNRSNFTQSKVGQVTSFTDNLGLEGTDQLTSVERAYFTDYYVNLTVQSKSAVSNIASSNLQQLQELYVAFFNRVPDADGLEYWIGQFNGGQSINQIAESFYNSGIAFSELTGISAGMTNTSFINVVYNNVLGRSNGADPEGLSFWTTALQSGVETKATLVASIITSAHQFKGDAQWGWVADLLDNKVEVANLFSVEYGLNNLTSAESISKGMAVAAAVTATDTTAAIELIGIASTPVEAI